MCKIELSCNRISDFIYFCLVPNIGGLNHPFVKHKNFKYECLLDYMRHNIPNIPCYIRNFLEVNKQVFSALKYFEERKYVHRDIKRKFHFEFWLMCKCK